MQDKSIVRSFVLSCTFLDVPNRQPCAELDLDFLVPVELFHAPDDQGHVAQRNFIALT